MKLSELKKMIGEEYKKYLSEQDLDMVGAQPPMGMDPMVNVSGGDIDIEGGDSEETLRQIYDMLKAYFEGGASSTDMAMPAAEPMDTDMEMDLPSPAADDMKDDEDKEEDEDEDEDDDVSEKKKDKEDLKERFKKLANIIKD